MIDASSTYLHASLSVGKNAPPPVLAAFEHGQDNPDCDPVLVMTVSHGQRIVWYCATCDIFNQTEWTA